MHAIRHVVQLKASPDAVHAALSEQGQLQRWWTRDAEVDPYVGGQLKVDFRGDDAFARFTIDDRSPRRVLWRCTDSWMAQSREWNSTMIEWLIEPAGDGVRLTMSHDGFGSQSRCFRLCDDGWAFYITESLARLLETGEGMPYEPEVHALSQTR